MRENVDDRSQAVKDHPILYSRDLPSHGSQCQFGSRHIVCGAAEASQGEGKYEEIDTGKWAEIFKKSFEAAGETSGQPNQKTDRRYVMGQIAETLSWHIYNQRTA